MMLVIGITPWLYRAAILKDNSVEAPLELLGVDAMVRPSCCGGPCAV
jgi:hypothetical protein